MYVQVYDFNVSVLDIMHCMSADQEVLLALKYEIGTRGDNCITI